MKTTFTLSRKTGSLWAKTLVLINLILFSSGSFAQYPAGSPVAINGKLKLVGTKLSNECGNPVQLRGMSSHGLQWFGSCVNTSALDALVNDWKIDIFRLAMYVQETGYVTNPSYWKGYIDNMVDECGKRGIYCLIDWHVLNPGDPNANLNEARDFWTYMATKHGSKKHVLYEICNEPNGVDWSRVKSYANDIIPRIRAVDPNTVIIVGTPNWSQDVDIAANDKLNFSNIMYTLHFYSGTHSGTLRSKANTAMSRGAAIFVTEFGTSEASGNGGPYLSEADNWISWMASNNISWCNWSFSDKAETSAALNGGACNSRSWNSTTQSGAWVKQKLSSPGDNFNCNGGGGDNNQSPVVTITAPANNASYASPATITINANASDPDGSVSKVDFYNGSTLLTSDASSPYSYTWSNVGAGTYTITAKATDNKGAVTTSSPITVVVTKPAVPQGPYSGTAIPVPGKVEVENYDVGGSGVAYNDADAGNSGNQYRTDENVDIEATTDAGGGYNIGWTAAGEWLEYSVNVTAAGTYDFKVRVAAAAAGKSFHVEMNGTNVTGAISVPNTGGWQTWQTVTIPGISLTAGAKIMRVYFDTDGINLNYIEVSSATPVNQAPAVSITAPANNASYTAPASVTINATASDADGTVSKVDFYNGNTLLGSDAASPYSYTWSNVAAGTYTITARATDNAGAVTTSAAVTVVVNAAPNQAPAVSITAPANNASYTAPASVTLNATASDADGTVSKVDFYNGNTLLSSDATSPYSYSWANVGAGTYTITARATDNAGGVTTSAPITVVVNGVPNQAPSVAITAPANNASYTAPASVTINATASDADGTVSKVDFYNGNTLLSSDATSPYSYAWTNVGAGTYTITARATDNAGALTTSAAVTIVVNGAPNQAPTVAITAPASNASYTTPASVTINATASDADGIVSKVDFYNGSTLLGSDPTSPYSYTWTNVGAGTYTITAKATDNAGAVTTSAPVAITVITVQPGTQTPYSGTPVSIPGKVEAENYDLGGSSVAYNDGDAGNNGGAYRNDNVDVESTGDAAGGGYNVGWTASGEWLEYSVNVTASGTYDFKVRVAATANAKSFHIEMNGTNITGPIAVPNTGAWQTYQTVTVSGINLTAGNQIMRVAFDTDGINLNYVEVAASTTANQAPAVAITAPANNATFPAPASVTINATAADADGTLSRVEFYNGNTLLGSDATAPYSYTWTNVAAGTYSITAKAIDNGNATGTSAPVIVTVTSQTAGQYPYSGTPVLLPGKVEAENYDLGGSGVAFNDTDAGNNGGAYRKDNVDIEVTGDASGGYNVGWIAAGEWLEYTVNVTAAGTYDLKLRVAATADGKKFHVEMNGVNITGAVSVPNTGGWQKWATVTVPDVTLTAGVQVMRIVFDSNEMNLNYVEVSGKEISGNPPVVAILDPLNNSSYTSPASVDIIADASDDDGSIAKVEFYNGSTLIGSDATAPYSFSWNNVLGGTYTLTAKATDDRGNVVASAPVTFSVIDPAGQTIQCESACYVDGVANEVAHEGFRGTGYINTTDAVGATAGWYVNSLSAQTVNLSIRYAHTTATGRNMSLKVNGTTQVATVNFPSTGSSSTWVTIKVPVNLVAGSNYIQLVSLTADGSPYLDELTFASNTVTAGNCPATVTIQGEAACTVDGTLNETANAGFRGTGYLNTDDATGASASWKVKVPAATTTGLSIRYAHNTSAGRDMSLSVNGVTLIARVAFPATWSNTAWGTVNVQINLAAGENTIKLVALTNEGSPYVDELSFSSLSVSPADCGTQAAMAIQPQATVSPNPAMSVFALTVPEDATSFVVTNTSGTVVYSGGAVAEGETISFGNSIPSGLYALRIQYASGRVETKIIQKTE